MGGRQGKGESRESQRGGKGGGTEAGVQNKRGCKGRSFARWHMQSYVNSFGSLLSSCKAVLGGNKLLILLMLPSGRVNVRIMRAE